MRTVIVLTAILLSGTAMGATVKQAWNLPADAIVNGEVNGRVTAPSDCLLDNDNLFSCTNEPKADQEPEDEKPKA